MSRKNRQAEIEVRRKKVAANLLGGLNYRDMAEALGVSIGTIAGDVRVILGRWQREQVQAAGEVVLQEVRRLDRALNAIWDKVNEGDYKAIETALKIMERRARLLGLDAPARQEISGKDGGPIKILDVTKLTDDELKRIADGEDPASVIAPASPGGA